MILRGGGCCRCFFGARAWGCCGVSVCVCRLAAESGVQPCRRFDRFLIWVVLEGLFCNLYSAYVLLEVQQIDKWACPFTCIITSASYRLCPHLLEVFICYPLPALCYPLVTFLLNGLVSRAVTSLSSVARGHGVGIINRFLNPTVTRHHLPHLRNSLLCRRLWSFWPHDRSVKRKLYARRIKDVFTRHGYVEFV